MFMSSLSCPVSYLYKLIDPETQEIRYIGQTRHPEKRLNQHLKEKGNYYKTNWVKSVITKGLTPIFEVFMCTSRETINQEEQNWIRFYFEQGCKLVNTSFAFTYNENISRGGSKYYGVGFSKNDNKFISWIQLDNCRFIGGFKNEKEAALWHDRVAAYYGLDVNDTPDFTCSLEDARTKIQQERNKNGYIGVNQTKSGKYSASIVLDRKDNYLGSFDTPEEAAYYADATRNFYNLTNNQTTEDRLSLEEARLKIAQQTTPKGIRFSGTNWIVRINVEKKEYNFGGIPTKEEAIYISDALRNYYGLRNSGTTQDKLSMEEVVAKYPQKPHDKNKVKKEKLFEGISQAEFIKQTTGRVGVTWLKREKKWQAKIYIEGKCHLLGTYPEDELETAQFVYDSVANYYFNQGARNSPENTGLMTIEEAKNFSKELNRKTEYIGIRPYKDISYQAFITLDNKQHRIGTFRDLKQAIYYTDAVRNHYNKKSNNTTTDKLSLEDAKLKIKQLN
jgi:hypothetical protein